MLRFLKALRNKYLTKLKSNKYSFGENFHAGRGAVLWAKNKIVIGDNIIFSQFMCQLFVNYDY